MLPGALEGVRVVEWGEFVSAPYCGKILAELGADVIKVERPDGGDSSRGHGPFPDGAPDPERSGLYLFNNLNKRGVTLDVNSTAGRENLDRLLEYADVFLENQPLPTLVETDLDYPSLEARHTGLVVTSLSPYGRSGPYREYLGYDINANALGGMSFGTGYPHREPLTTPLYQVSYLAGVGAAFASIVALLARGRTGRGQLVDVAESQVVAALLSGYHLPTFIYQGVAGWRSGNRMRLGLFPNCVLPCKDGYVCIDAPQLEQYRRFLALIGNAGWVEEPRYRDRRAMSDQYPEEAEALITPWFMEHSKDEILRLCMENRVPCVPVRDFREVLADEHLNFRQYFQHVEHPRAGDLRYPGPGYRFSDTPCRLPRPAPSLGQHNRELLTEELAVTPIDATGQGSSGATGALPLANYRVVDFGTAWAGPMAAQLLGDLGAEVIKVESRARMDGLRLGRPLVGEDIVGGDRGMWPDLQPVFHSINRNKSSVTLDLKTAEGLAMVKELIARSDLVLNNFSPGVLERLGLDYPALRRLCPDIILVSMPSVGSTGPLRDLLAYAPIIQALSGLMSLVGYPNEAGSEEPLVGEFQSPWSDAVASMHAAIAAVAALFHRNRTGQGQEIEVAQLEATTSMLGEALLGIQMGGEPTGPNGNRDHAFAPQGNYPCADEDRWISIAIRTEEEWDNLRAAMGSPAWAKAPGFARFGDRVRNAQALDQGVANWTRGLTADEATQVLQAHGVAAMPVMNIEHQFLDPHLQERGTYGAVEHPLLGTEWIYGLPWVFSATPGSLRQAAPNLGQHNESIVCDLLGHSRARLEHLVEQQAVY